MPNKFLKVFYIVLIVITTLLLGFYLSLMAYQSFQTIQTMRGVAYSGKMPVLPPAEQVLGATLGYVPVSVLAGLILLAIAVVVALVLRAQLVRAGDRRVNFESLTTAAFGVGFYSLGVVFGWNKYLNVLSEVQKRGPSTASFSFNAAQAFIDEIQSHLITSIIVSAFGLALLFVASGKAVKAYRRWAGDRRRVARPAIYAPLAHHFD